MSIDPNDAVKYCVDTHHTKDILMLQVNHARWREAMIPHRISVLILPSSVIILSVIIVVNKSRVTDRQLVEQHMQKQSNNTKIERHRTESDNKHIYIYTNTINPSIHPSVCRSDPSLFRLRVELVVLSFLLPVIQIICRTLRSG